METRQQLPFEGANNFWELGGYPAWHGRKIRHGVLYRGCTLSELSSASDQALLRSLELKLVLDLRSKGECEHHPEQVPDGVEYVQVSALRYPDGTEIDFSPGGMEKLEAVMRQCTIGAGEAFASFYEGMPFENSAFKALFQALEEGKTPLLFHCSAGKDRTGIAAMLILLALGADLETALEDYMLTNVFRQKEINALLQENAELLSEHPEEKEMLIGRAGVTKKFAQRAMDAIIKRYSDFDSYFLAEYGLDKERLGKLRDAYLE